MKSKKYEIVQLVFIALSGLILLFIIAPLFNMLIKCSPAQLLETAVDTEVQRSVWLTLLTSMGATLICSVAGIPLAYLLARREFPFKQLVNGIIDIPVVIPHSAAGIALLGIIAPDSLLGQTAEKLGFSFMGGYAGIMVGMAFVSVPFLINAARDGFETVPERLEKAALNLGASPLRVFFTISVPLASKSILSGLILMWGRGMSEFGAVIIIAYHPMITPILIYERFGAFGLKYARPISVLFIGICLLFFLLMRLITYRKHNAQG